MNTSPNSSDFTTTTATEFHDKLKSAVIARLELAQECERRLWSRVYVNGSTQGMD